MVSSAQPHPPPLGGGRRAPQERHEAHHRLGTRPVRPDAVKSGSQQTPAKDVVVQNRVFGSANNKSNNLTAYLYTSVLSARTPTPPSKVIEHNNNEHNIYEQIHPGYRVYRDVHVRHCPCTKRGLIRKRVGLSSRQRNNEGTLQRWRGDCRRTSDQDRDGRSGETRCAFAGRAIRPQVRAMLLQ